MDTFSSGYYANGPLDLGQTKGIIIENPWGYPAHDVCFPLAWVYSSHTCTQKNYMRVGLFSYR